MGAWERWRSRLQGHLCAVKTGCVYQICGFVRISSLDVIREHERGGGGCLEYLRSSPQKDSDSTTFYFYIPWAWNSPYQIQKVAAKTTKYEYVLSGVFTLAELARGMLQKEHSSFDVSALTAQFAKGQLI